MSHQTVMRAREATGPDGPVERTGLDGKTRRMPQRSEPEPTIRDTQIDGLIGLAIVCVVAIVGSVGATWRRLTGGRAFRREVCRRSSPQRKKFQSVAWRPVGQLRIARKLERERQDMKYIDERTISK